MRENASRGLDGVIARTLAWNATVGVVRVIASESPGGVQVRTLTWNGVLGVIVSRNPGVKMWVRILL